MGVRCIWSNLLLLFLSFNILAHGDADVLIAEIDLQIAADPENAELYFNRGVLYQGQDHYNEAFLDYHKVKELEPGNTFVDHNLAKLCYEHDLNKLALHYIQAYLSVEPESIKGIVTRGLIYQKLERYADSENDFLLVVNSKDAKPEHYDLLADILLEASNDNIGRAIQYYQLAQSKIGQLSTFSESIIQLELLQNNIEDALSETDLLIEQSNRKERWYVLKGDILSKANRLEEAEIAYKNAQLEIEKLSPPRKNTDYVKSLILEIESALTHLF